MPEKREAEPDVVATGIPGVFEVHRRPVGDARGSLLRIYADDALAATDAFPSGPVQINLVTTASAGTVRGLHLQVPPTVGPGEAKLVTCVAGRVFDVAVDLRPDSSTRFRHHAVELAADGLRSLLIPPGVAHGMQALEDGVRLLYLHAAAYDPTAERGVRADDPDLAIPWPLPPVNLSERDRGLPIAKDLVLP